MSTSEPLKTEISGFRIVEKRELWVVSPPDTGLFGVPRPHDSDVQRVTRH